MNYLKNMFFDHQTTFLDGKKRVLQVFGPDTLQNAIKITSKTKFSTPIVQIPSHLHPALSYSLLILLKSGIIVKVIGIRMQTVA